MISKLFKTFNEVNKECDYKLLEISVKKTQIKFIFKESLIFFPSIVSFLETVPYDPEESFITFYDERINITFGGIYENKLQKDNIFYPFMNVITQFAEEICACPSLEFVISELYLKCFLDKPGIGVDDLKKYEEILNAEGKGGLELHPQRPYLLFVNEEEFTEYTE